MVASARVAPLLNNMLNSYSILWNSKPTMNELTEYFQIEEYINEDKKKIRSIKKIKKILELKILILEELDLKI